MNVLMLSFTKLYIKKPEQPNSGNAGVGIGNDHKTSDIISGSYNTPLPQLKTNIT